MPIAVQSDVEASMMRELTPGEAKYVLTLLERVESRLLSRIPDLAERAEGDIVFRGNVVAVEAEAVARVFRSPDGGRLKSETEGNYSYQLNMMVASGLLDVLDREWELLGVGVGAVEVAAPITDKYLETRRNRGCPPDRQFQYCWPAQDSMSTPWGGSP